jgi:sarcosine oxidase gamma subunit
MMTKVAITRSEPHRLADRPGTHTTAGASATPHRRTRSLPDSSGMSQSSYPTARSVMSALSSALCSSEDSPAMSAERRADAVGPDRWLAI